MIDNMFMTETMYKQILLSPSQGNNYKVFNTTIAQFVEFAVYSTLLQGKYKSIDSFHTLTPNRYQSTLESLYLIHFEQINKTYDSIIQCIQTILSQRKYEKMKKNTPDHRTCIQSIQYTTDEIEQSNIVIIFKQDGNLDHIACFDKQDSQLSNLITGELYDILSNYFIILNNEYIEWIFRYYDILSSHMARIYDKYNK